MKNRWGYLLLSLLLPLTAAAPAPAMAGELEELRSLRDTTIALLNQLVQQGVLTREKADELIRQAEQAGKPGGAPAGAAGTTVPGAVAQGNPPAGAPAAGGAAPPVAPGVVRVPYVPETVKQEIREEVKKDVLAQAKQERWGEPGALPQWLGRISFGGDVRFRFQADRFPTDNVPNALPQQLQLPDNGGYNINNTSEARNRLRLRARFGAEAKIGKTVTAVVRLTTGSAGTGGDPSTENENLGNYNARGTVGFDRAYLSYRPVSWAYFTGGRLGNPFFTPTTLVWGDDLSLQGAVVGLSPSFGKRWQAFATAGIFPIQDTEPTPLTNARSKWLYGYQAGFSWQPVQIATWKLAAALYDYRHIEGTPDPSEFSTQYDLTAAAFRQKGNSVFDIDAQLNTIQGTQNYVFGLASKFREANVATSIDFVFFGTKHIVLDADWVRNIGFKHSEILARTGLDLTGHTKGMQERLTVGDTSFARRNSWQAYIGYRRVERDAVVDAFTDADFRLGGTNARGPYMGARYAFETNSTLGFRWYSGKQIDGLPLAIDVLQVDLIAQF